MVPHPMQLPHRCTRATHHASHSTAHMHSPHLAAPQEDPTGPDPEPPFDVLLTTYSVFEREELAYRLDRTFLSKWRWGCMICDEAHALKNAGSTRSRKLRKVRGCRVWVCGGMRRMWV